MGKLSLDEVLDPGVLLVSDKAPEVALYLLAGSFYLTVSLGMGRIGYRWH